MSHLFSLLEGVKKMKVKVGQVAGTHGIKGELKIYASTDFLDERFAPGGVLTFKKGAKESEYEIESHRYHKKMELVKLVGLDNINDVEGFKGYDVYAIREDDLEEEGYYFDELIGCHILDEEGVDHGKVIHILQMPTQDVLEIQDESGKTFMLPYVDAFILDERIDEKIIVVSLIEGIKA